jgi:hypothetical protein
MIKNLLRLTLFVLFISGTAVSQSIPNPGFEAWTGGNPDNWTSTNVAGFAVPVTQSGESHGGSSSARLEIINFNGEPYLPGLVFTDAITFTQLPANFTFYYRFTPQGNDALEVALVLYKETLTLPVAAGSATIGAGAGGYTAYSIPLEYFSSEIPNYAYIIISIGDTSDNDVSGTIGSFALIDDVSFDGVTAVDEKENLVKSFELKQNYPNPFNPETNFIFNIQDYGLTSLKIYDILGNEAAVLLNEVQEPGEYKITFNAAGLSSGVYFAKLTSGGKQMIKKIMLMK